MENRQTIVIKSASTAESFVKYLDSLTKELKEKLAKLIFYPTVFLFREFAIFNQTIVSLGCTGVF